jgi:hypothetical protein
MLITPGTCLTIGTPLRALHIRCDFPLSVPIEELTGFKVMIFPAEPEPEEEFDIGGEGGGA